MSIRVLIADDQALVRAGFRLVLEDPDDIEVVAEASNGEQAIHGVGRYEPDVVLMDIRMPELDGIAATRSITSNHRARVLVLTTYDLDESVYDALQAGASGFLLKDTPPAQLIEGIRAVAAGEALLAPSVTRRLIEEFSRAGAARRAQPVGRRRRLTPPGGGSGPYGLLRKAVGEIVRADGHGSSARPTTDRLNPSTLGRTTEQRAGTPGALPKERPWHTPDRSSRTPSAASASSSCARPPTPMASCSRSS
jgi:DNA-binding NarL/FixJ family response regulator